MVQAMLRVRMNAHFEEILRAVEELSARAGRQQWYVSFIFPKDTEYGNR
jgi:hypothetical protein